MATSNGLETNRSDHRPIISSAGSTFEPLPVPTLSSSILRPLYFLQKPRMESSKHQSWKISVHARSKGLDFRINASNILPHWGEGGEKISLFLRLFRFFSLKVESKNRNPLRKTKRKSKLFHFLAKIFPRPRELIRSKLATKKRSQSPKIVSPPTNGSHHPCQVLHSHIQLFLSL